MTVKELKEFLKDIPDDVNIVVMHTTKEISNLKYIKATFFDGSSIEEIQIS